MLFCLSRWTCIDSDSTAHTVLLVLPSTSLHRPYMVFRISDSGLLCLSVLLLASAPVCTQSENYAGNVYDQNTGDALPSCKHLSSRIPYTDEVFYTGLAALSYIVDDMLVCLLCSCMPYSPLSMGLFCYSPFCYSIRNRFCCAVCFSKRSSCLSKYSLSISYPTKSSPAS